MSRFTELAEVLTTEEMIRLFPNGEPPPPPVDTLYSLTAIPKSRVAGQITLHPEHHHVTGELEWVLYIPPTTKDSFDHGEEEGDFDPTENPILAPFGETRWSTLFGAVTCLKLAVEHGSIKFNDGRVVK